MRTTTKSVIIFSLISSCLLQCVDEKGPNLARGKPVSQSSSYTDGEASRAVDGNPNPSRYDANSCSHTNWDDPPPWWFVDLKKRYFVNSVAIINRSDSLGHQLKDFDVIIAEVTPAGGFSSGVVCYIHNGTAEDGQKFNLPCQGKVGRFVGVRFRTAGTLSLCEVEVFGIGLSYAYDAKTPSEELKLVATKSTRSRLECSSSCVKCLDCYKFSFTNGVRRMYGKDVIAGTPSVGKRYKKTW